MSGMRPARSLRSVGSLRAVLRLARLDLRTDISGTLLVALLVLAITGLATLAPVWFARAANEALPALTRAARPIVRDVAFSLRTQLAGFSDQGPLVTLDAAGDAIQAGLPASLGDIVAERVDSADTQEMLTFDAGLPGDTVGLSLRIQDGIGDRATYLRGRPPAARASGPIEIAISSETALQIDRDVGQSMALAGPGDEIPVDIVGVFEAVDPGADYWADTALSRPIVRQLDQEHREIHGTALAATGEARRLLADTPTPSRNQWRFIFDWSRLDARAHAALANDLARLQARYPFRADTAGSDIPSLSTGLAAIVERYEAERVTAQTAMILAVVGPAFAALGAIGLAGATVARRRQGASVLVRARGATTRQLLGARALVAGLTILPAVLLGCLPAVLSGGADAAESTVVIGLAVAAVSMALVLVAARDQIRAPTDQLRPTRPARWWGGPSSVVRDLLLVAVAVAGIVLIGQRSAVGGAAPLSGAALDPLLILVPVLIAVAGGVLVWRCYVPIVILLARLAAALRGFAPVHAMRGPARGSAAFQVPLLVLVVTIAIGVFTTVIVLSLQHEQALVAWQHVGATFRVEAVTRYTLPLDVARVPGVERVAGAYVNDGVLAGGSVRALPVVTEALDVPAYDEVTAGTLAASALPESLRVATWDPANGRTEEEPIPAVLVGEASRRPALRVGGDFQLSGFGEVEHFRVAGILPAFPGATAPQGTVIVPLGALRAALPDQALEPSIAYVRAPQSLLPVLRREAVDAYAPTVSMEALSDVVAAQRADPLVYDVTVGFVIALVASLAFSAFVVGMAVVRDVSGRKAEIALLRAIGIRPGQILGIVILEQGTIVLAAIAAGLLLGTVMSVVAVPSLGLDRFVRPGDIVGAVIEWPTVSLIVLVQACVALVVMLVATVLARRRDPAPAMMTGDA